MANSAQCYYCFECLAASFERREPASLATIGKLWEQHEQVKCLTPLQATGELDSLTEKSGKCQTDVEDECSNAKRLVRPQTAKAQPPQKINLPSVNHTKSQLSSGSSSTSTTPSTESGSSSHTAFSSDTIITTPGSKQLYEGENLNGRQHPLFVTWNTVSKNGHKSLRGCIGTFEAQELSAGLKSYALISAFDDTRFSPIPASLIPCLSCSLTLLSTFEPCTDAMDWTLGIHGLRISFIHRGRRYGATYLPDVPVEQGWSKEETVESLMRKAGWDGSTGSVAQRLLRGSRSYTASSDMPWDQVSDFRSVRYQGLKASASYAQWQEWRNWVLTLEGGRDMLLRPAK